MTAIERQLEERGFAPSGRTSEFYLRGAPRTVLVLREQWAWIEVRDRAARRAAHHRLAAQFGRAGLWRDAADATGTARVFEMPLERSDSDSGGGSLLELLDWALATREGGLATGWQPPPRAEVEACFDVERLTVRAGARAVQGELQHVERPGGARLALAFPLLARVPAQLGRTRRRLLGELLLDAQRRWRLVRVGVGPARAVAAEIDLSGAPHAQLEPLLGVAMATLPLVVEWLLPPLTLLVDPSVQSRALGPVTTRAVPAERNAHHA